MNGEQDFDKLAQHLWKEVNKQPLGNVPVVVRFARRLKEELEKENDGNRS